MDHTDVNQKGIVIRPATAADVPAIAAIQAASPEAASWDPFSYLEHDCRVAGGPGSVDGFLAVRKVAADEHEILNLAVAPAKRHIGIARTLLADALGKGHGAWFLEVRASNAPAIRLYESVGFKAVGRRQNYYYGPSEDCIVMRIFS